MADIFRRTLKKRMEEADEVAIPMKEEAAAPKTMSQAEFAKGDPAKKKRPTPPPEMLKKQGYKKGGLVRGAGAATRGVKKAKVR